MFESRTRFRLSQSEDFKGRVLILSLQFAHTLIAINRADPKILAKAHEVLNTPDSFKDKLPLLVAAHLPEDSIGDGVTDDEIMNVIEDVFTSLAGKEQ